MSHSTQTSTITNMKIDFEAVFLSVIFALMLWLGMGVMMDHQLSHDKPYAFLASDAFQHEVRVEGIKLDGSYKYEPFFYAGGHKDIIGHYMPIMYHLAVQLSNLTGVQTYDTLYFIIFLLGISSVIVFYFVVARFNKPIAILSVPIALLLFSIKGSYVGFIFGNWGAITGLSFLACSFWAMANIDLKYSFALIGIFFSATILGHSSEFIYLLGILIMYAFVKYLSKQLTIQKIKTLAISFVIMVIVSAYFLVIFYYTFYQIARMSFEVITTTGVGAILTFTDFGWIILGLGALGFLLSFKFLSEPNSEAIIFGYAILLAGLTNFIGQERAFNIRFFWPVFLAVFFGIGLYFILKTLLKKVTVLHALLLSIALIFFIVFAFEFTKAPVPGIMTTEAWQMFSYIKDKTPIDSRVYFMCEENTAANSIYGNAGREGYFCMRGKDHDNYVSNKLFNGSVPAYMLYGAFLTHKISLFSAPESYEPLIGQDNICNFDYAVYSAYTSSKDWLDYNNIIADRLTKSGWKIEFQNRFYAVLKNPNKGGDCLAAASQ